MDRSHDPLDRLEARLERLTARVDELSRVVERRNGGTPARVDPETPGARERARPRRRRHVGHASRV